MICLCTAVHVVLSKYGVKVYRILNLHSRWK